MFKSKCKLLSICFFILIISTIYKCGLSQPSEQINTRPNIVFILIDDLGWKDLGTYGSTFYETPNIDKLASKGMKFTDAYASSPVCSPSRASIMTGQYPVHTGITDWIPGRQNTQGPQPTQRLLPPQFAFNLSESETTIAESLQEQGYVTCYAGKWHLGLKPSSWPLAAGFDYNYGGWAAGNPWSYGMGGYFSPWNNPKLKNAPDGAFLTDWLTTKIIEFIKKQANKGSPFFANLSFYAVHERIQAKEKYVNKFKQKAKSMGLDTLNQFIRNSSDHHPARWMHGWNSRIVQSNPVYAGLIYSVDQNVGRLLKALKQFGIADNTIVVLTSDNGGLSTIRDAPTSNLPLRYGKGWLYEGGIRIPLIIKWPGITKPGSIARFPVINTDLYPTLLQMAGLPPMPKQAIDGVSLVPILKGKMSIDQPTLYWHYPHYHGGGESPGSAMRQGKWKLIKFYNDNHLELYNLETDIGERHNLVAVFPQKAAKMVRQLNRWVKKTHAKIPDLNPFYNSYYGRTQKKNDKNYQEYLKQYRTLFGKDTYMPLFIKQIRKKYHENYPELK